MEACPSWLFTSLMVSPFERPWRGQLEELSRALLELHHRASLETLDEDLEA